VRRYIPGASAIRRVAVSAPVQPPGEGPCGDGCGVARLLSRRRWAAKRRWFTRAARRDGPACCGSGCGGGVVTVDTQSRRPQTRSPDGCSVIVAVRSHGSFPDSGRSFAQRMRPVVPFFMCVPHHPVAVEGRAQRMSLRLCLASTPLRCCAPSPHRKS
jgi:hypothetical protein